MFATIAKRTTRLINGSMLQKTHHGAMNYLKQSRPIVFHKMAIRQFSSLPDHIKLEMPNLSPTMEKVSDSLAV